MIGFELSGSTARIEAFLDGCIDLEPIVQIRRLAQQGVDALRSVTPEDTGLTAASWNYEIVQNGSEITIWWTNDNIHNGFKVAIGLQYGHGTGTGGYVEGQDYINPALKPVFDEIGNAVWEEVQKL